MRSIFCLILCTVGAVAWSADLPASTARDSLPGLAATQTVFGASGLQLSAETVRLLYDGDYRAQTYPETYQISTIPTLIANQQIPFALWTLINVRQAHPEQSRHIAMKLAQVGIRAEQYLNAFYTYALADPEIFHFDQGAAHLANPKVMEEKLNGCKILAMSAEQFARIGHPAQNSVHQ